MKTVTVYTRRGCHLCEELIEELIPIIDGKLQLEVRDVDTNTAWRERWGTDIPVVECDDEVVCMHFLDRDAITGILRG